jgi:hypothetical protein
VLVAAMAAGCGSDTRPVKAPPPQPDTVARTSTAVMPASSIERFKADLVQSNIEIDRVLATLGTLTNPATAPSDLRRTFDTYSDQLARMTQHSEQMKREAEQMRDAQAAYFARWEEKAAQIDNPSLRASAEERKSRLRAAHERITSSSLLARDAYDPFMRDLQDVRKYLAADLSPTSVQMLGDVSKRANADGAAVKQRINTVIRELDAVEGDRPD